MQSINYFFALGVAGYVVFVYGFLPLGSLVHPGMKASFLTHSYGIYIHAFASTVALAIGFKDLSFARVECFRRLGADSIRT